MSKSERSGKRAKSADHVDMNFIIEQLIQDLNVKIHDVSMDKEMRAYKMGKTDVVLGGISFKLTMGNRPANEKIIMNLLMSYSQEQGTAMTGSQCRAGLFRWLFSESERQFKMLYGAVKGKNSFDINDYHFVKDSDLKRQLGMQYISV